MNYYVVQELVAGKYRTVDATGHDTMATPRLFALEAEALEFSRRLRGTTRVLQAILEVKTP